MEHDQGHHVASRPRSLAIPSLGAGLSLCCLTLAACASSASVPLELPPSTSAGEVAVVDASYSLRVEADQVVSGSLAVEVVDPRRSGGELRSLSERELVLDEGPLWLPPVLDPGSWARISVDVTAAGRVLRWQAPRALPLEALDPRDVALGLISDGPVAAAARASFVDFAEQVLLHRDPLGGQPLAGGVARAWFGLLAAPRTGEDHPIVETLADVLFAMFREADAEAASELEKGGWYRSSADADWATPRWLLLRDRLGKQDFTEALRAVVDAGAAGQRQGLDEVAAAFSGEGANFIRSWFRGPAGPLVEASWRMDAQRSRLLLRVDQLQRVQPGSAPAYSFTLPVVIKMEDGGLLRRSLEVNRRKELFQLPVEGQASEVDFDPGGTLEALVKLRTARDD